MLNLKNVQGDKRPQELEINIDTVYKRSNIHEIIQEEHILYEYDEIQYTIEEYLKEVVPQLELAIAELSALVGGDTSV